MKPTELYPSIRAMLIDIDGTLTRGHEMLPGMLEFFRFLRSRQINFMVASNNSSKAPATYYRLLHEMGADIEAHNVMTCSDVTAWYLKENFPPGCRVYVIGQEGVLNAVRDAGCEILPDGRGSADAVVVGGDDTLTYEKLKNAVLHIQRGAAFIGTNPDILYPTPEGLVPECGTTLAALQAATGVSPVVMGKPHHYLYDMAMQRMGARADETAMLGDRLETDIQGAIDAGLKSILVCTGVDNAATVPVKGITPDLIVDDLPHLIKYWEESIAS